MAESVIYSDITYDLTKNQYSDIVLIENHDAIKQAIKTILLTKKGARTKFQNPYFGSNLHHLLFEKITNITANQIKTEIISALDIWEPRIEIIVVNVVGEPEKYSYIITINYKIVDLNIIDDIILNLEIIR